MTTADCSEIDESLRRRFVMLKTPGIKLSVITKEVNKSMCINSRMLKDFRYRHINITTAVQ